MRRSNAEFMTRNVSHEGRQLTNRDYFGYVEMEEFSCYIMADSLDEDIKENSARHVVESIIRSFTEKPTLSKRLLNHYIMLAHEELKSKRGGMRLKASVVMVVTNYQKMRYLHVGNSRFYLIRNSRFLEQTKDQSLTNNMIEQHTLAMDQVTIHEERNNLYSYLGENTAGNSWGKPEVVISPLLKLEDGDILAQLTRGAWEILSDGELLNLVEGAKEPQEIIDSAEDLILGQQDEKYIDNFSLAITLVSKVYIPPEKKFSLKKILLVAIPVILIIAVIGVALYINNRSIKNKEYQLTEYMRSGEEYLKYDNHKKAAEEYTEAKKLATELKRDDDKAEADLYLKLAEQIIMADEAFIANDFIKAQELYITAKDISMQAGNVGKSYIELQLSQTKDYIEIYDWISVGEIRESYDDLNGAIEAYRQARLKATALYARDLRDEALTKQSAAEEKLTMSKQAKEAADELIRQDAIAELAKEAQIASQAREIEEQQNTNDLKSAIELENQGNELITKQEYENAITFYRTAQSIYYRLGYSDLGNRLDEKIEAAKAGNAAEINAAVNAAVAAEKEKAQAQGDVSGNNLGN